MYCIKCGTELPDNAEVCSNCGESVYKEANNNYNNNQYYQSQQQPPYNAQYQQPPYQQYPPNAKSAYLAGVIAIIIGAFGVHNFYLGYTGKAVAQLLISILTCGIGAIFVEIWVIVEAVQLFTGSINVDANGVPLKLSF